ncbi:4-alpha-glucanotransferase, partial [Oscillospiraceae bacterium OttesenSCG-928-G22]|nr:4-alpha-glucanotransferase [Oscillospiraceae bacterium OttesenSCG-928-G22]
HSVDRWCYLQFLFFSQWRRLRAYANERGVKLIGDVPLYVSSDSAEVWAFPELFQLDGARRQTKQAGVPPDYFSAEGQLWGNPLYDWTFHRETGYDWWIQRLAFMDSLFDVTRIDHFRGFADYCSIDIGADDARQGCFTPGPGMEFFRTLRERLPAVSLIAEDLGLLSEEAKALRLDTGLPGMAVMQFAFSRDMTSEYLPHRMGTNLVVYLGTHDNDTFWGWLSESGPEDETGFARDYMRLSAGEGFSQGAVKMLFASPADLAIVQMQDILGLGSEARMNTPGTLGGNWTWRMGSGVLTKELTEELRHITETYDRLPRSGEI